MVDENRDKKKPDDVWESLHQAFNTNVPWRVEQRLKSRLAWFREDLQMHPYVTEGFHHKLDRHRKVIIFIKKTIRPIVAACALILLVTLGVFFFPGQSTPTWADVLKRLSRSNFVTASLYIRHQPFSKPEMVEYWRGRGDKLRILSGHLVTFVSNGSAKTFNLATRKESGQDDITRFIMNLYNHEHEMIPSAVYAKSLYQDLYSGKAMESTYRINASPEISDNLLVFDLKHKISGLFLRVWVLRTSMLPIRLHYWNEFGSRTDVLFSYSNEQPAGFFDPDIFESAMRKVETEILEGPNTLSAAQLMYLGLEDAAGRAIPAPGI